MALELTFDRSLPRSTLLEKTGFPELHSATAHGFDRFQRYQKVTWDVRDLPVDATWGWGPCAEEGPVILDGLSLVPLSGGRLLEQALGSSLEADKHIEAWVGLLPNPDWLPHPEFLEDARRGGVALKLAQTPAWNPEILGEFRKVVGNARVANATEQGHRTLLGVLLEKEWLSRSSLHVQAIEWIFHQGATAKGLFRSRNRGPETPWAYLLEHTLPHPEVLDPEHPIDRSVLKAFLNSDLDLSSSTLIGPTKAWAARHQPGKRPELDPLMADLRQRLLETAWEAQPLTTRRPRF